MLAELTVAPPVARSTTSAEVSAEAVLAACVETGALAEAAYRLGLTERQARRRIERLFSRLGVTNRVQAVAWLDDHRPGWRGA